MKLRQNSTGKFFVQLQTFCQVMMSITMVTKPGFTALFNTLDKQNHNAFQTFFSQVAIPELYGKKTR